MNGGVLYKRPCPQCNTPLDFVDWEENQTVGWIDEQGLELFTCPVCEADLDDLPVSVKPRCVVCDQPVFSGAVGICDACLTDDTDPEQGTQLEAAA